MITLEALDAACLRKAAQVLEARTRKPNGLILQVQVKTLRSIADDIESGKAPVRR